MPRRDCIEVNMTSHWELLQRGIYRREVQLELYYEVERLGKLLSAALDKIDELEKKDAQPS
jgi:hypothetical protein